MNFTPIYFFCNQTTRKQKQFLNKISHWADLATERERQLTTARAPRIPKYCLDASLFR